MSENYNDYKAHVIDDIETCIDSLGCQPILFVGSGLSMRYMRAPNWEGLLKEMVDICPNIDKTYPYYKQSYKDTILIGSAFVEPFKEWAWSTGKNVFPEIFFTGDYDSDIYLKYKVSEYTKQRVEVLDLAITSTFGEEKQQQLGLADFM